MAEGYENQPPAKNTKNSVRKITGVKGGKGGRKGPHTPGKRFDVKELKKPSKERINNLLSKDGIHTTYFSAEGAVPKPGAFGEDSFYSNHYLQKNLWREREPPGRTDGPIGRAGITHKGRVPLKVFFDALNEALGIEDFRETYEFWKYRYEVSYSVKTDSGLYNVVLKSEGDQSATPEILHGSPPLVKG